MQKIRGAGLTVGENGAVEVGGGGGAIYLWCEDFFGVRKQMGSSSNFFSTWLNNLNINDADHPPPSARRPQ